ncbi:hypothetical protein [Burkholderia diffusa]|uniref:hypothetical protein n=1 Tax=Burkholderia diffusa TaxID=488732 RepID=UPI0007579B51|nr:hypothetical protein [Burkholderia diffusa]KVH43533.1 hypothetical protein WJ39_26325 [Burkholderia diffusa]
MSNEGDKKPEMKGIVEWPWAVIVSVFGAILLGIAYSSGDGYYTAILRKFWIDDGAFPIDKSKHLVLSVWSAWNAAVAVQNWLGEHKMLMLELVLAILGYIAVWVVIEKALLWVIDRTGKKADGSPRVSLWPTMRRYFTFVFWGAFWTSNLSMLGIFLPVVIAIPSAIGSAVGESIASDMKKDFDLGCWVSESRCQMVIKGGKEVARGYVVAQSATHIALYYEGNTTQLALDGSEIRTVGRPNFDQAIPR